MPSAARDGACADGVCSLIMESLALSVPVVASGDGTRPPGAITSRRPGHGSRRRRSWILVRHSPAKGPIRVDSLCNEAKTAAPPQGRA